MLVRKAAFQTGFTMIEVLVTLVILAIGILGMASMQSKMSMTNMESYQRAQATLLLGDMINRINANQMNANAYLTTGLSPAVIGVGSDLDGDGDSAGTDDCTDASIVTVQQRDHCEWSNALKGVAETQAGTNVGAMIGARGCVELLQAANPAAGVCTPAIYRVSVVWQGLLESGASTLTCAQALDVYGGDAYRRIISGVITIGLLGCD